MNTIRILALALILSGVLGLIYGGFSFTKETHEADLGVLQLKVDEKQRVNIPIWLGAGLVALGTLLLIRGRTKI